MKEAGLKIDKKNLFFSKSSTFEDAYNLTDRILERKPEGILCINDLMTLAIMKRMIECHVNIPNDISVGGFDDIMFAELAQKPITTVRQPLDKICGKAMDILLKNIEDVEGGEQKENRKQEIFYIKPQLVIRETTR
jgi:LacI family transcriptional regulator